MKNFILRTLTGTAYVAVIVVCIMMNSYTMLALTALLALWAMIEFNAMHNTDKTDSSLCGRGENILTMLCGIALIGSVYLCVNGLQFWSVAVFVLLLCARMISAIYSKQKSPLNTLAHSIASLFYIAFPLALLNWIYAVSPYLVLAIFVMIWLNDTGAFIVGSSIGRHKMFPRISPKKSWEGLAGGFAVCIGLSVVVFAYYPQYFELFNTATFIVLSMITAIFATWGDLLESLIKRTAGVKDSGTLLPGHGGIMDRIDSLLLVSPAVFAYLIFLISFE